MQVLWFWLKAFLLIGVVGWLVIFTGVGLLVDLVLYFIFDLFSITAEPYFRNPVDGQTYSWLTVIRYVFSFVAWFIFGRVVWLRLRLGQSDLNG
jgi:hypothetical protein